MDWDSRLKLQVTRQFKNYQVQRLALDTALVNKHFPLPGDTLIVVATSSNTATATVRLNRDNNDPLELTGRRKYQTVFTDFYVSCDAQADEWLDILVGIDFDVMNRVAMTAVGFEQGIAQPCITLTNATPDVDTQAASHTCIQALIQAPTANTGTVWLNFGAAAVADSCFELMAGGSLSVSLDNTSKIHAIFTIGGEKVIIVYKTET